MSFPVEGLLYLRQCLEPLAWWTISTSSLFLNNTCKFWCNTILICYLNCVTTRMVSFSSELIWCEMIWDVCFSMRCVGTRLSIYDLPHYPEYSVNIIFYKVRELLKIIGLSSVCNVNHSLRECQAQMPLWQTVSELWSAWTECFQKDFGCQPNWEHRENLVYSNRTNDDLTIDLRWVVTLKNELWTILAERSETHCSWCGTVTSDNGWLNQLHGFKCKLQGWTNNTFF